ncbi:MAG: histidine ammonia-lyase [Parcubacteria group bacterium Gr01-1014_66]|nr:MAG: histidine ammonia-lyase [Parcubacteria group bacterium Gr01-1014_66]
MQRKGVHEILIDGKELSLEHVMRIVFNPRAKVALAPSVRREVERSHAFLAKKMSTDVIYGVNTGFGPMASHIIGKEQMVALQENLIRSHATGIGDTVDPRFVLATMIVRLNTLAKGASGVSYALLEQLVFFINKRIVPVVYEHGAVGTSGDLVQLAHIALALMGEGSVWFQGNVCHAKDVLTQLKRKASVLKPKEGLSLINGTSMMTGIGALVCMHAERILALAVRAGALALELVNAYDDSIAEGLHRVRPHKGQVAIARMLRELLASSRLLCGRHELQKEIALEEDGVHKIPEEVQEIYSFRCIPQILGPIHDSIATVRAIIEVEMNAATDNPIVDAKNEMIFHGGNFHGDYVASAMDQLKIGLVKLTLLAERRINFFLNEKQNLSFPPFLNVATPGLTLGLQGLQFVATSTAAQSQSLAYPHSLHTIPTNGDNQDVVSMGTDAALFAAKVVENAYILLTIELITLAQAVDVRGVADRLSVSSRTIFSRIRAHFPLIKEDRVITTEFHSLLAFLQDDPALIAVGMATESNRT